MRSAHRRRSRSIAGAILAVSLSAGPTTRGDDAPRADAALPPAPRLDVDAPPGGAGVATWADPRVPAAAAALALALVAVRLTTRRASSRLPAEVFAVLGEAPLGPNQTARVVRFGPRVLLVGVSGSTSTTLAVIDDARTVGDMIAACGETRSPRRVPAGGAWPARWPRSVTRSPGVAT